MIADQNQPIIQLSAYRRGQLEFVTREYQLSDGSMVRLTTRGPQDDMTAADVERLLVIGNHVLMDDDS